MEALYCTVAQFGILAFYYSVYGAQIRLQFEETFRENDATLSKGQVTCVVVVFCMVLTVIAGGINAAYGYVYYSFEDRIKKAMQAGLVMEEIDENN